MTYDERVTLYLAALSAVLAATLALMPLPAGRVPWLHIVFGTVFAAIAVRSMLRGQVLLAVVDGVAVCLAAFSVWCWSRERTHRPRVADLVQAVIDERQP